MSFRSTLKNGLTKTGISARFARPLAVGISLLLAIILGLYSPEGPVEQLLHNARDSINSKPASGRVHIVEIDAKSLAALDKWPWSRGYHAQLVDELDKAGVAQIVFDVDFSSYSTRDGDQEFAAAIERADGKVVLPTFRQPQSTGEIHADLENLPIPILREKAFLGSVNVRPDADGQVNDYPFGTITDSIPRPSIGALLGDASGPVNKEFKIDQAIEISSIPRHSFVDVLEGRVDARELKGKKVVIGATAIEIGDRYATARFGVIPGVVVQAMAAETLIAGTDLPELGPWPMLALTLIAVLFAIHWTDRRNTTGVVPSLLIAITILVVPLIAERYSLAHLDVTPALLLLAGSMAAQYVIGITKQISLERRIDRATGLPNLAAWQERMDCKGNHNVIVAEIANFGEIVATLDRAESKKLVRAVADRLELSSGPGELHRIGRERFCWRTETMDSDAVETTIEASASLFNTAIPVSGRSVRATLCFGVATGDIRDAEGLANQATLAAKRASELGKRLVWHNDRLAQVTDQSLFILSEFEEALMTGQISVFYQPKYSLINDFVNGAEALVRWEHPDKGMVSPSLFVPVLEHENLMEALTLFVLRQVVEDVERWNSVRNPMGCAVNISASLLANPAFAKRAVAIIRDSGIDPALLTIELTETAALSSQEMAASSLNQFKQLGAHLSIDDYGTGQSTLTYLKSFSADEIKIDQSFVKLIATDNANKIMVRSSIEMAHALGMKVVAEGVEDIAALNVLREFGCDTIQGWYVGKPVARDEFMQRWCLNLFDSSGGTSAPDWVGQARTG
jgi:diguanylate cyclase